MRQGEGKAAKGPKRDLPQPLAAFIEKKKKQKKTKNKEALEKDSGEQKQQKVQDQRLGDSMHDGEEVKDRNLKRDRPQALAASKTIENKNKKQKKEANEANGKRAVELPKENKQKLSRPVTGEGSKIATGGDDDGQKAKAWKVAFDDVKGRILVAIRDIKVGEVILEEEPLVCASSFDHRCLLCHETHDASSCKAVRSAFPPEVVKHLSEIEKRMVNIEAMELELDRVRAFIKILNLCRGGPEVLEHANKCTAVNMDDCREVVKAMRKSKSMRVAIPEGLTDDDAARLLSVLNTNSHELAEWGGSGLYPLACIMEHNCRPNCSFTTHGTRLWVTAIEHVHAGEALSIDYGEAVFEPTVRRVEHLEEAYGFTCTCRSCTVLPDRCRAFTCPAKSCKGPVCPVGKGLSAEDWKCVQCGHVLTKKECKVREAAEAAVEEVEFETVEVVDAVLAEGILHSTHHDIFHALLELGEELAAAPLEVLSGRAEQVWRRVCGLAEDVLQRSHGKKAIFWDNLAQVLVARGDIKGAREAFEKAYEVLCRCSGESTPPTLAAKRLVDHTPKTTAELEETYADVQEKLVAAKHRNGVDGLKLLAAARV